MANALLATAYLLQACYAGFGVGYDSVNQTCVVLNTTVCEGRDRCVRVCVCAVSHPPQWPVPHGFALCLGPCGWLSDTLHTGPRVGTVSGAGARSYDRAVSRRTARVSVRQWTQRVCAAARWAVCAFPQPVRVRHTSRVSVSGRVRVLSLFMAYSWNTHYCEGRSTDTRYCSRVRDPKECVDGCVWTRGVCAPRVRSAPDRGPHVVLPSDQPDPGYREFCRRDYAHPPPTECNRSSCNTTCTHHPLCYPSPVWVRVRVCMRVCVHGALGIPTVICTLCTVGVAFEWHHGSVSSGPTSVRGAMGCVVCTRASASSWRRIAISITVCVCLRVCVSNQTLLGMQFVNPYGGWLMDGDAPFQRSFVHLCLYTVCLVTTVGLSLWLWDFMSTDPVKRD